MRFDQGCRYDPAAYFFLTPSHEATKNSRAVCSARFPSLIGNGPSFLCGVDTRRLPRSFCSILPSLRGFVAACDGEWLRFEWEPGRSAPAVENRSLTTLKLTTIPARISTDRSARIRVIRRFSFGGVGSSPRLTCPLHPARLCGSNSITIRLYCLGLDWRNSCRISIPS